MPARFCKDMGARFGQKRVVCRTHTSRKKTMAIEILAPISVGELFDKISILEIKLERLSDADKLANVGYELSLLQDIAEKSGVAVSDELPELCEKLKSVNIAIWEAEDKIRDFERLGVFDGEFLKSARSIYRFNDARAAAKRAINKLTSSAVVEEKGYAPYNPDAEVG
jgi:hypothetical protein